MITLANALTAALAHLQAHGPGHSITVPLSAWDKVPESLDAWCLRRNLTYSQDGKNVTLSLDTTAPTPQ